MITNNKNQIKIRSQFSIKEMKVRKKKGQLHIKNLTVYGTEKKKNEIVF